MVFAAAGIFAYIRFNAPYIREFDAEIARPGTVIRLIGGNFGDNKGESRVFMDGIEPTLSSYRSWSSTTISIMIPLTMDSGLIRVVTPFGRSNPVMFLNPEFVPVLARKP
jgi:hypothetical protein